MRILLIAFLALASLAIVQGSVIGIDFGSEWMKISLISPGKSFVIIENHTTKRKTENAIAFFNKERIYESDAVARRTRSPRNTFVFLNKFLGALANDEEIIRISRENYEDYLFELDQDRGTFAFKLENFAFENEDDGSTKDEEELILRVEDLVGMILKYANYLVEKQFQLQVKQCVITVPSGWSISQRSALKQATRIAGLETLAIMHENSAAALYYGLERMDNTTHTALFYNLGSYNLQVTLAEYQAVESNSGSKKQVEAIRIISDYSVPNVGGSKYDLALAHYFAKQFDAKRPGKKSIFDNKKGFLKMLKASNKYKEVLSANKETPVYIEGVADNEDFRSTIDRATFEDQIRNYTDQLTWPIDRVLEIANRTKSDINVVELIGGGVRVPKVQQTLQQYFGEVEVGTHLNGDESMALGAAFHAANQSHSFKVRPIHFHDGFSFDLSLEISSLELSENDEGYYNKSILLYPYKKRFGTKRNINFNLDQNVKIEVYVQEPFKEERVPCVTYFLNNITGYKQDEKLKELGTPKVHLEFDTNSHEFLVFLEASVLLNETYYDEVPLKTKKVNQTEEAKVNVTEETKNEGEESEEKDQQDESTDEAKSDEEKTEGEPQVKRIKRTRTHELPINVTYKLHVIKSLNTTEIQKSQRLIRAFEAFEERQRKLSEAKNKLEGFIYYLRDALEQDEYKMYSTESERQDLLDKSSIHQNFLDSEVAYAAPIDDFTKRFAQLSNLMKPIVKRLEEHRNRPQVLNETSTKLSDYIKKHEGLANTMPWVSEEQKSTLRGLLTNTTAWLERVTAQQEKKKLHEDPAFSVQEITPKMEAIQKEYAKIKSISKPKKKKEKKTNNTTTSTNTTSSETEEQQDEDRKQEKEEQKEEQREEQKEEQKEQQQQEQQEQEQQEQQEQEQEQEQEQQKEQEKQPETENTDL